MCRFVSFSSYLIPSYLPFYAFLLLGVRVLTNGNPDSRHIAYACERSSERCCETCTQDADLEDPRFLRAVESIEREVNGWIQEQVQEQARREREATEAQVRTSRDESENGKEGNTFETGKDKEKEKEGEVGAQKMASDLVDSQSNATAKERSKPSSGSSDSIDALASEVSKILSSDAEARSHFVQSQSPILEVDAETGRPGSRQTEDGTCSCYSGPTSWTRDTSTSPWAPEAEDRHEHEHDDGASMHVLRDYKLDDID